MTDIVSKQCDFVHIAKDICDTNDFEYICFIDAGTFKETYHVKKQDEDYALKVFKPNNSIERASREIDAMLRARCTNIAKLIMVNSHESEGFIFQYLFEEYLSGGTLGYHMKTSNLSKSEIVLIGSDLVNALETTFSQRIVHRDIKPDNIMFRDARRDAVLVDFGLVRDLDATSLTKAFHMMGPGTPLYSAPEQLNNEKALIDWRTDQFALGVTLCEAILHTHPFEAGSPTKTVEKIASRVKCNVDVVKKINDLKLHPLVKMIEPYPINRYRTPEQLKGDWLKLEELE